LFFFHHFNKKTQHQKQDKDKVALVNRVFDFDIGGDREVDICMRFNENGG